MAALPPTRLSTSTTPSPATRWVRWGLVALAALGLVLVAFQMFCRCTQPLGNTDVFWQVRTGELTLSTGHVPDTDPFSYTIAGEPWNNHEWAYEILAALLHRTFGWGALRALVLVCWGGAALAVGVTVARRAGPAEAFLVLNLFHLLAGYKLKPVPQTVSMPLLLGAIYAFRGPRMLSSRRRAAALIGYLIVWGNLTAEALTFLPILFLDQLCLRRGRRDAEPPPDRTVMLLLGLAFLAPLVTPPWSSVLDYTIRGTAVNRVVNTEFTPIWEAAAAVQPLAKLTGEAVVLAFVAWATRGLSLSKDRWATLRAMGPGLAAVAGAVLLERDLWLLVVPAGQMLIALARWARSPSRRVFGAAASLALGLLVYWAYGEGIGWSNALAWEQVSSARYRSQHLDEGRLPFDCVEHLRDAPPGTRLFTLRMWASYVIWRLPQVRVFYDGRNLEYGIELFEAGSRIWGGGPDAAALLDRTRTGVVLARPGWEQLPGLRGSGWQPVATGAQCSVFTRAPGGS